MKKLFIVAIIAIVAMPARMVAQVSTSTAAAANIVTPLTLTQNASLHFGTMSVSSSTAGTCVLATDGTRSATGGVNLSSATPTSSNASYSVSGLSGATYAITLPTSITVSSSGNNMTVNDFTAKPASAGSNATTGTLTSGSDNFTVGATLNVPSGQATGLYSGTFNITVAYN